MVVTSNTRHRKRFVRRNRRHSFEIETEGNKLWELGCKFEDEGNINAAVTVYLAASIFGNPLAQSNLGNILDDKLNKPEEAVYWYKLSAKNGASVGALNLSVHYKNLGSRRWYIYWLNVAARMGHEDAITELKGLKLQPR